MTEFDINEAIIIANEFTENTPLWKLEIAAIRLKLHLVEFGLIVHDEIVIAEQHRPKCLAYAKLELEIARRGLFAHMPMRLKQRESDL